MTYEVIRTIENSCKNNQMRDVFFEEIETDDPDSWVRQREPFADEIVREELSGGIRFRVFASGLPTIYTLTEV